MNNLHILNRSFSIEKKHIAETVIECLEGTTEKYFTIEIWDDPKRKDLAVFVHDEYETLEQFIDNLLELYPVCTNWAIQLFDKKVDAYIYSVNQIKNAEL